MITPYIDRVNELLSYGVTVDNDDGKALSCVPCIAISWWSVVSWNNCL